MASIQQGIDMWVSMWVIYLVLFILLGLVSVISTASYYAYKALKDFRIDWR